MRLQIESNIWCPSLDWIASFFHRKLSSSGNSLEDEEDFREVYHPPFDKYKVDLVLQSHLHAYERTYHPLILMIMKMNYIYKR